VRLFGLFSALNLEGNVFADASFKVNILNTNYAFKDSVKITPTEFSGRNIKIHDLEGHNGTATVACTPRAFQKHELPPAGRCK